MAHVGDHRLVLAYLDDAYILSTDNAALTDTYSFFEQETTSLELNKGKCASVSFDDIRRDGFELLGTVVGPAEARLSFLNPAASSVTTKLDKLRHLPHQHTLILTRQCVQQDVRRLQRTLQTDDLPKGWTTLDSRLAMEIKRLSAGRPGASPTVDSLLHLPARLGGMGIPLAWKASQEDSDGTLPPLLGSTVSESDQTAPPSPRSSASGNAVEGCGRNSATSSSDTWTTALESYWSKRRRR